MDDKLLLIRYQYGLAHSTQRPELQYKYIGKAEETAWDAQASLDTESTQLIKGRIQIPSRAETRDRKNKKIASLAEHSSLHGDRPPILEVCQGCRRVLVPGLTCQVRIIHPKHRQPPRPPASASAPSPAPHTRMASHSSVLRYKCLSCGAKYDFLDALVQRGASKINPNKSQDSAPRNHKKHAKKKRLSELVKKRQPQDLDLFDFMTRK